MEEREAPAAVSRGGAPTGPAFPPATALGVRGQRWEAPPGRIGTGSSPTVGRGCGPTWDEVAQISAPSTGQHPRGPEKAEHPSPKPLHLTGNPIRHSECESDIAQPSLVFGLPLQPLHMPRGGGRGRNRQRSTDTGERHEESTQRQAQEKTLGGSRSPSP